MIIQKKDVVCFVADKVIEYFKDVTEIPSKLEIQKAIGIVTDGVEVAMGTKHVKETVFENGCKVTKEYDKEVTKPLIDYYVKISVSEVKAIQEKILENIAQIRYPVVESKGTVSQALKELKKAAWMIKSYQIVDFVRAIAKAAVYSEGKWEGDEKYQQAIYLKSEVEGTGKSTLNELLMKGAEKVGLRTATGTYPNGRFGNLVTFASNNLVVINDTSYESIRNINVDKMKSLLRREKVEHEKKGLDPVLVEPKSAIIAAGNIEPPIAGDRCWKVFDCIGLPVTELDEEKKREAKSADLSLVFNSFNSFNSFNQAEENLKKFESENLIKKDSLIKNEKLARVPLLSFLLESLNKVKSYAIDFEKLTLKKFFDMLKETGTDLTYSQINGLTKAIKMLYAFGYVTKENCAANEYIQWNVTKLFEINPEELFVYSNESEDIYEEVRKTSEMWDELIAYFENNPTDPDKKPEDTVSEESTNCTKVEHMPEEQFQQIDEGKQLDDSWTICGRYDSEGAYDPLGDQVCVNKPLPGKPKNRKNENVKKENYLFECDDIPLDEQSRYIEELPTEMKDSILWVCKTGGKSLHIVLHTNTPDDASPELRKYIHSKLNEKYLHNKADPSTSNAGRIARAPNCVRQDKKHFGAFQSCLHFNMEATPLDVSKYIEAFKREKLDRIAMETLVPRKTYTGPKTFTCNTLEQLEEWNRQKSTKMKRKCIQFLSGTLPDWSEGLACGFALLNFGFSIEDILAESRDGDTWVKQVVKVLRRKGK